ncbi:MAG: type II secretion system protein [Planctomycetota bacterium]|jgi:prepilin-type N-terminal cleavage/methylation domain-containing protein
MRTRGFTLVEILIGVVILGILGAVVLPVYQGHAAEANVSAAKSNLEAIRTQIQLYKMEHRGVLPGFAFGAGVTEGTLANQLVGTSTEDGAASANRTPSNPFICGPYLLKIPANTLNKKSNIMYSTNFAADAGVKDSGWLYNRDTGQMCLNYPGSDDDGVAYIDY